LDTEAAMEEHGEQGVEMGLVQIAASLSTSVTGNDGVGRISGQAFGITVLMPPDPVVAIRMAQKILSRLMALASHGAPMASTARMALAWLPLNSFRLDTLERRAQGALQMLEIGKRISWVGGVDSHKDASQLLRDDTLADRALDETAPTIIEGQAASSNVNIANLYERIHRIEREMLQDIDTHFLVEEAERMSRALNEASASQGHAQRGLADPPSDLKNDYEPTEIMIR
jgi:hypothetical protein